LPTGPCRSGCHLVCSAFLYYRRTFAADLPPFDYRVCYGTFYRKADVCISHYVVVASIAGGVRLLTSIDYNLVDIPLVLLKKLFVGIALVPLVILGSGSVVD